MREFESLDDAPGAVAGDDPPTPPDGLEGIRARGGLVRGLPFKMFTRGYPASVLGVAAALDRYCMSTRVYVYSSTQNLANTLGISLRSAGLAVERLVDDGWLATTRAVGAESAHGTIYWMKWRLPDPFDDVDFEMPETRRRASRVGGGR